MIKAPTSPQDKSPFSDRLPEFTEALEVLYIFNNISGRQKFRAAWPAAAFYVFGEKLIRYDAEGADRAFKAQEEDLAEARRMELVDLLAQVRANSVAGGALQLSYIKTIATQFGPEMAETIFAPWVIEKLLPPPPPLPEKSSPLNLGRKRQIVDVPKRKYMNYRELVARAEKLFSKCITLIFNRKSV